MDLDTQNTILSEWFLRLIPCFLFSIPYYLEAFHTKKFLDSLTRHI